jgi:Xaa-Pro aminopeptidase
MVLVMFEFGGAIIWCEVSNDPGNSAGDELVLLHIGAADCGAGESMAAEIAGLVMKHGGGNRRLAVDRVNPEGYAGLTKLGVSVHDGQEVVERARAIKSEDEIACMRSVIAVCEEGLEGVRDALRPGVTENQLLAILNEANIAGGGEYIETRLLTSGPRTNPWFQESSFRAVESGDLWRSTPT